MAAPESEPYKILTETLTDTRVAAASKLGTGLEYGRVVVDHKGGLYRSCHFPVIAVLEL